MNCLFTAQGWEDYQYWSEHDRKTLKRVNDLVFAAKRRDRETETGKPEPLRGALSGCWSRRITGEHRLVYIKDETRFIVLQARYHYD